MYKQVEFQKSSQVLEPEIEPSGVFLPRQVRVGFCLVQGRVAGVTAGYELYSSLYRVFTRGRAVPNDRH